MLNILPKIDSSWLIPTVPYCASRHSYKRQQPNITPISRNRAIESSDRFPLWDIEKRIHLVRALESQSRSAPDTYLTGVTAALWYGFSVLTARTDIEFLVTCKHHRRSTTAGSHCRYFKGCSVHRRRHRLPREAYSQVKGVRIITPKFLLFEVLQTPNVYSALVTGDSIFRFLLRKYGDPRTLLDSTIERLRNSLFRVAQNLPHNVDKKRILSRIHLLSARSESPLETITRLRLREAGVPKPRQQRFVRANGQTYYADFAWDRQKTVLEVDGKSKYRHDPQRKITQQNAREEQMTAKYPYLYRSGWHEVLSDSFIQLVRSWFPRRALRPPRAIE